jgi:hypothetical protein
VSDRPFESARTARDARIEKAMTFCGVAVAGTVAALACLQITVNDGKPKINGAEHLALFGRPKGQERGGIAVASYDTSRPQEKRMADEGGGGRPDVDFSTTASIGDGSEPERSERKDASVRPAERRYRIQRVTSDSAFLEARGRTIILRVGESVAGVGQLKAIVRRDGRWVAIMGPEPRVDQTSR